MLNESTPNSGRLNCNESLPERYAKGILKSVRHSMTKKVCEIDRKNKLCHTLWMFLMCKYYLPVLALKIELLILIFERNFVTQVLNSVVSACFKLKLFIYLHSEIIMKMFYVSPYKLICYIYVDKILCIKVRFFYHPKNSK